MKINIRYIKPVFTRNGLFGYYNFKYIKGLYLKIFGLHITLTESNTKNKLINIANETINNHRRKRTESI